MSDFFDLERFRSKPDWHPPVPQALPRTSRKKTEPFLKGPIPMAWLAKATELGGSSLAVGVCLWFQHGVLGGLGPIKITKAVRRRLGLSPDRVQRGLKQLEAAGLVAFDHRGRGHCPVVRITEPPRGLVQPHISPSEATPGESSQGHPTGSGEPLGGIL